MNCIRIRTCGDENLFNERNCWLIIYSRSLIIMTSHLMLRQFIAEFVSSRVENCL